MLAIVLAVVMIALVLVGAVRITYQRRHRDADVEPREVPSGPAIGYVPGYMPGIQQKAERREEVATELVEPPHRRDAAVDLDSNTVRVRRSS
ncbi:hypothetical protein GCM10023201_57280 [Actinomycetospora corticicola]|uniref:Uncharacterized protein n=1 Tax=Actinomycetospora corticicola TaxID=663602 RepID=A0A7Y9J3R9_9PSEU|nr:hypothetical protein [Actinomycetospora corticicola]NYD34357.1 hypothetical protein [Actinomycetospora corticicola]